VQDRICYQPATILVSSVVALFILVSAIVFGIILHLKQLRYRLVIACVVWCRLHPCIVPYCYRLAPRYFLASISSIVFYHCHLVGLVETPVSSQIVHCSRTFPELETADELTLNVTLKISRRRTRLTGLNRRSVLSVPEDGCAAVWLAS
jgi:hypothetical protein